METIKGLYQKLWKSLIRPRRMCYSDFDLGGSLMSFGDVCAMRLDFQLRNALGELFNLSLYIPCSEDEQVLPDTNFIVYCHTHNGSRVEGVGLVERAVKMGFGFVVFDFRANGFSSGRYVTLGWLEALDINEVILFLKKEVLARSICLWGRSMGGCAILFYLSTKFREKIDKMALKTGREPVRWATRSLIQCVIVDSSFPNFIESVAFMVKNKAAQVPEVLVHLVLKATNGDIREKAGIDLTEINPIDFVGDICNPVFMVVGNEDELVKTDQFSEMFRRVNSKIKRIKLFKGTHAADRPEELYGELFDFVREMFKLKTQYVELKRIQSLTLESDKPRAETVEFPDDGSTRLITYDDAFDVNKFGTTGDLDERPPGDKEHPPGHRKNKLKIYDDKNGSILRNHHSFAIPKVVNLQKTTTFVGGKGGHVPPKKSPTALGTPTVAKGAEGDKSGKLLGSSRSEELALKLSAMRVNQEGVKPKWEVSQALNDTLNETVGNIQPEKFEKLMKESNIREKSVEKLIPKAKTDFHELSLRIKTKPTLAGKTVLSHHSGAISKRKLEPIPETKESATPFQGSTLSPQVKSAVRMPGPFVPEVSEGPSQRSGARRPADDSQKNVFNFSDFSDLDKLVVEKTPDPSAMEPEYFRQPAELPKDSFFNISSKREVKTVSIVNPYTQELLESSLPLDKAATPDIFARADARPPAQSQPGVLAAFSPTPAVAKPQPRA